jgi:hypothetical protein
MTAIVNATDASGGLRRRSNTADSASPDASAAKAAVIRFQIDILPV